MTVYYLVPYDFHTAEDIESKKKSHVTAQMYSHISRCMTQVDRRLCGCVCGVKYSVGNN